MKRLLFPILGFIAAFSVLGIDSASAALVDPGSAIISEALSPMIGALDNPENISRSTTWGGSLRMAIRIIINYVLYFLGLVATIMIIYAGFLYITAAGDDGKTEEAKKVILYTALGIIVILLSFAIVHTVLSVGLNAEPTTAPIDTTTASGIGRAADQGACATGTVYNPTTNACE